MSARTSGPDLPRVTGNESVSRQWAIDVQAEVERLRDVNADLLAACEAAAAWLHDPNDSTGHFERLAEAFRRDTGFMRPGKDAAAAAHQDPLECEIAWNDWRVARAAKVLADVRAAVAKAAAKAAGK